MLDWASAEEWEMPSRFRLNGKYAHWMGGSIKRADIYALHAMLIVGGLKAELFNSPLAVRWQSPLGGYCRINVGYYYPELMLELC